LSIWLTLPFIKSFRSFVRPAEFHSKYQPIKIKNQGNIPDRTCFSSLRMSTVGGKGEVENPMNPERYTEAAWEAIAKLPQYADKYSTQYVEAHHMLKALLDDGKSALASRIIAKAGVDVVVIEK
jgi:Clp amino terminal domain, pathogenicity island component